MKKLPPFKDPGLDKVLGGNRKKYTKKTRVAKKKGGKKPEPTYTIAEIVAANEMGEEWKKQRKIMEKKGYVLNVRPRLGPEKTIKKYGVTWKKKGKK